MFALSLGLSVLGLALGPLIVALGRGRALLNAAIDGISLGIVPVLLVLRMLPHLHGEIGSLAFVLVAAGYFGFHLIESRSHGRSADLGIALVVPALAIHSFLDGTALAIAFAGGTNPTTTLLLAGALVFHKLPEGLFFATTLVPRLGVKRTLLRVALLAAATLLGALSGRELLTHAPDVVLHGLVAVGLGIMLRLVVHDHAAAPRSEAAQKTSGFCFLVALALALLVPSPRNILAESQPRELSVTSALVPFFIETAPALLVGVIAGALVRALAAPWIAARRGAIGRALAEIAKPRSAAALSSIDASVIALSWVVLGPWITLVRTATTLVGALAASWITRDSTVAPHASSPVARRAIDELTDAFGASFDRIAASYAIGLVAAATLEAALAPSVVASAPRALQIAAAALAGVVGATPGGSTLVAPILVHKGFAMTATMALLLMAGTLSFESVAAVGRSRGGRVAVAYTASAMLFAALGAWLATHVPISSLPDVHELASRRHVFAEWICAAVVAILLARSLVRQGPRRWLVTSRAAP